MNNKPHLLATAGMLTVAAWPARADDNDKAMLELAAHSGCAACHQVEPGAKGPDGMAPVGPASRDVAAKYKGRKGAEAVLVHVVLTGSSPYDSHWKGKVSGLAMPPNKGAISQADAKKLVSWILALGPAKSPPATSRHARVAPAEHVRPARRAPPRRRPERAAAARRASASSVARGSARPSAAG